MAGGADDPDFPPVVVVSDRGTADDARRYMELGAKDYWLEPLSFEKVAAVARAPRPVATAPSVSTLGGRRPAMPASGGPSIVGSDTAIRRVLALARQAAARGEHPVVFGRMVTGETFLADEGRREAIRAAWHPLSVDMETAAVAHVCYVNQVPFLAVRTLTDTADQRGAACFEQNCDKAAWIAKEVTRTLLETWRCQGL